KSLRLFFDRHLVFVMAGLCPGHLRLSSMQKQTWMPGTRPGMTECEIRLQLELVRTCLIKS
ncbi:MAG TPA: hypothetical protein VF499_12060, partial [Afipia sp.]